MRLVTEELPEVADVTAAQIEQILSEYGFGEFVVLMASDDAFIQAMNVWEPGEACGRFTDETGVEPFRLEYRDGQTGRLFVAAGWQSFEEVMRAFVDYANGRNDWLTRFEWTNLDVS